MISVQQIYYHNRDEYGSLKQVHSIIKKTKGSSTALVIEDVGHTSHLDIPELVSEKCIDFIGKIMKE